MSFDRGVADLVMILAIGFFIDPLFAIQNLRRAFF